MRSTSGLCILKTPYIEHGERAGGKGEWKRGNQSGIGPARDEGALIGRYTDLRKI